MLIGLLTSAFAGPAQCGELGAFEAHQDIGKPKHAGDAVYNGVSQEYRLTASGQNMWAARDEFHFVWKKMKGDFILRARVRFLGKGVEPHRKLGWIVRESLDADSPYADAAIHGEGLTSLQFRRTKGAVTEQIESTAKGPDVVQFEKKGNDFIMSVAKFGEPFTETRLKDFDLGSDELYVGLFLCAHNPEVTEQAVFSNVRIIRPAAADFRPYRDYIGSVLEILNVETGDRQAIHQSKIPFEAPNWTPDGSALLFNSSGSDANTRGRLYRFDLLTRQETQIDTGFATRLNNDHVLSFDGTMVGISDQSAVHGGKSAVFTLPSSGGTPKRITINTPSYLHSWSPDGQWLVYTGGRSNEFDIFKMAADGTGEEINLTNTRGLDDGPEFDRTGQFIYFNSARTGRMQLWRMKSDGSAQEQLTNDAYNNWFPHISPDGRWIAFISFPGDIDPTDHPYYKHVYLRLMPVGGGPAKVIAYVYGGQGTINVPSWSPDSRMLAFVSNTGME